MVLKVLMAAGIVDNRRALGNRRHGKTKRKASLERA
jgi:hypothetical protein